MAKYALIENGKVENVIEWDGDVENYTPPLPAVLLSASQMCSPGDLYDGATFTKVVPPAPVPESVTPLQIRRAIRVHAKSNAIRSYLQELSADEKEDWEFATNVHRSSPLIAGLQTAIGATNEEMDDLFRAAIVERD